MNKPRIYTPQELEQLHEVLYEILNEIVRVCQKHQIPFLSSAEQPSELYTMKPSYRGMMM